MGGLSYDQILCYLKDAKKEDRLEKYKALLKFRNIHFEKKPNDHRKKRGQEINGRLPKYFSNDHNLKRKLFFFK